MIYWQIPPQARETAKVVDLNSHQCINGAANMNNIKAKLKLSIGATAKLEVLLILNIYFILQYSLFIDIQFILKD